jgi:hypothetical protein
MERQHPTRRATDRHRGRREAPALFGQPRVMALFLVLTLFQHLIDGLHNRDLRVLPNSMH